MAVGIAINYVDRVNISHAMLSIAADLKLTRVQQGAILSAFSLGYVAAMLPGGFLVDRIGPGRMAAIGATAWSMATAWTAFAHTPGSLLLSRIAVGIGEAPIFPANARLVRERFPLHERGLATALFDSGSYFGTAVSAPIVVSVILLAGWRWSFGACTLLGLLWVPLWVRTARASHDEGSTNALPSAVPGGRDVVRLLSSKNVLAAGAGFFCYNYVKSFFLTWFPTYLVSSQNFSFGSVGYVGLIPPLCAILADLGAGWSTDRMIRAGVRLTVARKAPICLGLLIGGIGVIGLVVATNHVLVIAFASLAFASTMAASSGIWAIPGDIAPRPALVGTIGGIQNTFSNMAGFVAPLATGILLQYSNAFSAPLILSAVAALGGAVLYWFAVGSLDAEPSPRQTIGREPAFLNR
jgi:MFS family permease